MKVKKNKFSIILNFENLSGSKTFGGRGATPKQLFIAKNRHFAFTLAEILVVITILGVIASITISSAVNNATRKATVVKVLRAYSDLQRAFDTDWAYNGNIVERLNIEQLNGDYFTTRDYYRNKFIIPNLQIIKDCASESGKNECFPSLCYALNGEKIPNSGTPFSPCTTDNGNFSNWYGKWDSFKIKGGYSLRFENIRFQRGGNLLEQNSVQNLPVPSGPPTTNAGLIAVDVNGLKKPNTVGKDIFIFALTPKGIAPMSGGCNPKGNAGANSAPIEGIGCSDYIIKHRNMDYLK